MSFLKHHFRKLKLIREAWFSAAVGFPLVTAPAI